METKKRIEAKSTSVSWMYPGGPVFQKGEGVWLWDEEGNKFFDGTGGSGALNLGHSHPKINEAIINQLNVLTHTGCKVQSTVRKQFMAEFADFLPFENASILPTVTGAETVEAAIKVVRAHTKRTKILAFERSYHGKTAGAIALTWNSAIKAYSPINETEVVHCPAPVMLDNHEAISPEFCLEQCRAILEENQNNGTPIAALIIEPLQATEGVLQLGKFFLNQIAELAKEFEALLIFDEIYTGFGRTGKPFYFEHFNIIPDVLLVGKALGNGLPMGAVIASKTIMDALPSGIQTSTFSGLPLACAAGYAVLKEMKTNKTWDNASQIGAYLRNGLDAIHEKYGCISKSRGVGLMIGFDCTNEKGEPCQETTLQLAKECLNENILFFKGGYLGTSIRLTPALIITERDADFLLQGLEKSCKKILNTNQLQTTDVVH